MVGAARPVGWFAWLWTALVLLLAVTVLPRAEPVLLSVAHVPPFAVHVPSSAVKAPLLVVLAPAGCRLGSAGDAPDGERLVVPSPLAWCRIHAQGPAPPRDLCRAPSDWLPVVLLRAGVGKGPAAAPGSAGPGSAGPGLAGLGLAGRVAWRSGVAAGAAPPRDLCRLSGVEES